MPPSASRRAGAESAREWPARSETGNAATSPASSPVLEYRDRRPATHQAEHGLEDNGRDLPAVGSRLHYVALLSRDDTRGREPVRSLLRFSSMQMAIPLSLRVPEASG